MSLVEDSQSVTDLDTDQQSKNVCKCSVTDVSHSETSSFAEDNTLSIGKRQCRALVIDSLKLATSDTFLPPASQEAESEVPSPDPAWGNLIDQALKGDGVEQTESTNKGSAEVNDDTNTDAVMNSTKPLKGDDTNQASALKLNVADSDVVNTNVCNRHHAESAVDNPVDSLIISRGASLPDVLHDLNPCYTPSSWKCLVNSLLNECYYQVADEVNEYLTEAPYLNFVTDKSINTRGKSIHWHRFKWRYQDSIRY